MTVKEMGLPWQHGVLFNERQKLSCNDDSTPRH
jgi:hypothetical protein